MLDEKFYSAFRRQRLIEELLHFRGRCLFLVSIITLYGLIDSYTQNLVIFHLSSPFKPLKTELKFAENHLLDIIY